jgi:hypothetical protein
MGQAIGETLPIAIAIALSPMPVSLVILVLFSARARINGPLFVAGWSLAIALVLTVLYLIADAGQVSSRRDASDAAYWVVLSVGLLLLGLAWLEWRWHPLEGDGLAMPKWMGAVDSLNPAAAFAVGAACAAISPKNLLLLVGAAAQMGQVRMSSSEALIAALVFVLLSSLSILVPVAYYLFGGAAAEKTLEGWREWLARNSAVVAALVLVILGVMMLGRGISGLA